MKNISVGSVCSGIEAASVAWDALDFDFKWFSEISPFPSKVLLEKYQDVPNLGDMCTIPDKLKRGAVDAPDLICGGTPCQAFSLAGWKKGLEDDRGNLTLKFVDIIETSDRQRIKKDLDRSMVFWENVEGVLRDKTNAFGCFLASLAGVESELRYHKWPNAGIIHGPKRNIAWRVLDAKYFGLPQQRRRLYVLAGDTDFYPEDILFDGIPKTVIADEVDQPLVFEKEGHSIQLFRHYTDCLYSAYGTKWNGNAAAYNGSLFVSQNGRLRRFSPLECERLMGFPDNYTDLPKARPTNRYQAAGNSWAVPVISWIGKRIEQYKHNATSSSQLNVSSNLFESQLNDQVAFYPVATDLSKSKQASFGQLESINGSVMPEDPVIGSLIDVIDVEADKKFYITPVGCKGILRRKEERRLQINSHLEEVLLRISSEWSDSEIEAVSRIQKRGRFSDNLDYAAQHLNVSTKTGT